MDLFAFLNGISPWWWIAFAILLGIVEVLTFSFFLIWPALAAFAVGIVLWIAPELSGAGQVLIFAVLAVLFTVAGRYYTVGRPTVSEKPALNSRSAQLIGQRAVVIDGFEAGRPGSVEVGGVRWRAVLAKDADVPQPGDVLDIADADGMTLIVRPQGI